VRFFIMGGGCYGSFYARQLLRARAAGALAVDEIGIVDSSSRPRALEELPDRPPLRHYSRLWDDFLDERLAHAPAPDDMLVTPPFTPHLALAWLLRALPRRLPALHWTTRPFVRQPDIPFHLQKKGGPLLLSHADWICPVNCIEPDRCPRTRGPRDWDMDHTARKLARSLAGAGQPVDPLALFHCHHIAYGVGAFPLARLPQAAAAIASAAARAGQVRALVGTISHCHGALHLLEGSSGRSAAVIGTEHEPSADPFLRTPTPNPDDRLQ
jgi:hypothetical protein